MMDVARIPEEVDQEQLALDEETAKFDRTGEDLLFEVLLRWGLELTLPIRRERVNEYEIFDVEHGTLIACFDKHISRALVSRIAELQPLRVVLRDSSFESDAERINAQQTFAETASQADFKTI